MQYAQNSGQCYKVRHCSRIIVTNRLKILVNQYALNKTVKRHLVITFLKTTCCKID